LSEKYFLVSMRPSPQGTWGIYLVDVFDNMLKLAEAPGRAFFEPMPVTTRPVPPRVPDRVDRGRSDAVVFLSDVYEGGGLKGVPRGTVKKLRLVSYAFSYRGMGGLLGSIGLDGPWDMQRVLGTVPVEPDGSALFRVPASTPIAVQPLDDKGQALQLMRSWFTAMPGEVVSCAGCHEGQRSAPTNSRVMALERSPSEIAEWFGPPRGFSFAREVQPVLDRSCVRCHDGKVGEGSALPDLRGDRIIDDWATGFSGHVNPTVGGRFSASYVALRRLVRAPGIESDIHMLAPMDFHASTTELVRMLRTDHHGATIDDEGWDRLITWIDLNTPYHGTWREMVGAKAVDPLAERARAMRRAFTGRDEDLEWVPPAPEAKPIPRSAADAVETAGPVPNPTPVPAPVPAPVVEGWPFDAAEAAKRQGPAAESRRTLDLGGGVTLDLVRVPAGSFVMGDAEGPPASRPSHVVRVERPYWMGATEVTNAQFARFDPTHDSHVESMHAYQFGIHGHALDKPNQPVVRVSWERARAFCAWLREKAGATVDLPTEAQWEHACRAGAATAFSFGGRDTDFAPWANLGDVRLKDYMLETYIKVRPVEKPTAYDDWVPKDDRFDDGSFVSAEVGRYRPNAWGLFDMHGNVWEWTRSQWRPYPSQPDDGRDEDDIAGPVAVDRVARGGSWHDRPFLGTSAFRLSYRPYQGVYNVGFRVMMEVEATK
jgi:formylglycine-generating enzyme required for sulfatase activity